MYIDALGQPCPMPVVKAKSALQASPGGTVQILVDNSVACENLQKMAVGMGYAYSMQEDAAGNFLVSIASASSVPPAAPAVSLKEGLVVCIGRNSMGDGSEELGKILLKGFIFSLTQLASAPRAVLLFNSGISLAIDGANTVEDLRTLAEMGVKIGLCGTCVNYFDVKASIAVGEIVNMYDIVEAMAAAGSVINI